VSERDQLNAQHPALVAFVDRNRRSMRIYAAVIALLVLIGFGAVKLAYAHGELDHVTKQSAAAPVPIPNGTVGAALSQRWRTDDHPAGGTPYSDGVVVTYGAHSVNGRDAVTGQVRWHYTRTDETICSVVQQDRSTIAIYNRHGHCSEVTGFVTATGVPKFYRTLTDNGHTVAASAPNVVLIVGDHSVHVIDNAGGLDRWSWGAPPGCLVDRAIGGSQGVLISYRCGSTQRLALRELTGSAEKWNITLNEAAVPIAAHAIVATVNPNTGMLTSYSVDKGAVLTQRPFADPTGLTAALAAIPRALTSVEGIGSAAQGIEFVWAGQLYSLSAKEVIEWHGTAAGPPTLISDTFVATSNGTGIDLRATTTGQLQRTVSLSPVPSGTVTAYPVGTGLLIAGTTTEMYQ
jgi:hypothetical protein